MRRPETARRTLSEIDELYAARVPKRHWTGQSSHQYYIIFEQYSDVIEWTDHKATTTIEQIDARLQQAA